MSFNIGLSVLHAANTQLNVTDNNIANVAAIGFKTSRAEFADLYSATELRNGSKVIGGGVHSANVSQQFNQGNINNSGNLLDMGIQGQVFFVLSDNGLLTYSRSDAFKTDNEGYVTNSRGTCLSQGYGADANGKISNGTLTDLRIETSNLAPEATTSVSSVINLNSMSAAIIDGRVAASEFDPSLTATFTKQFTTPVFDTQGNQHAMDQYMVKTGANTWKTYTLIDGRNLDGSRPTKTGIAIDPVPSTITFDTSEKLVSASTPPVPTISNSLTLAGWVLGTVNKGIWADNGAAASPAGVSITLAKTTQGGHATGQINNLSISSNGVLLANFSNSQTKAIGQISLASLTHEQGLQPVGGTGWKETFTSGTPGYDVPQTGTLAAVVSNAQEESNVNLTNEPVQLIKAQSNYQANSKIISTENTILKILLLMR